MRDGLHAWRAQIARRRAPRPPRPAEERYVVSARRGVDFNDADPTPLFPQLALGSIYPQLTASLDDDDATPSTHLRNKSIPKCNCNEERNTRLPASSLGPPSERTLRGEDGLRRGERSLESLAVGFASLQPDDE